MKTFYLQINRENVITDAVTYQVVGYVAYETEYTLPNGVYGGWFKLENGEIVEYPELKPIDTQDEIREIKDQLQVTQDDLGTSLFESAMDKARIADLEAIQGEMLMEIAMIKMGGAL